MCTIQEKQEGQRCHSFLSSLNSIGQNVFKLESRKGAELHQFQQEPRYDGELSPCQV